MPDTGTICLNQKAPPAGAVQATKSGNGLVYKPDPGSVYAQRSPGEAGLWPPETEVKISGLKSRPDLNGKAGTVVNFDKAAGRYLVKVSRVYTAAGRPLQVKLRPVNLEESKRLYVTLTKLPYIVILTLTITNLVNPNHHHQPNPTVILTITTTTTHKQSA